MQHDFLLKHIPNEARMLECGQKFARVINESLVIFLYGNLGTGKTTLVRGLLQGLGHTGHVKSPTYTIIESYSVPSFEVYHFDLYRLKNLEELEEIGVADYFHETSICLIEWPEHGIELLPFPDLSCYIEYHVLGRDIKWVAHSDKGRRILERFMK